MTRVAKRPGSGKPPSNAPARGPGWGGAAGGDQGRGEKAAADALVPGAALVASGGRDPETKQFLLSPKGEAAERAAQEALGRVVEIMRNSEFEQTQKDCAVVVMQRVWGAPKETVSTENVHRVISDRPQTAADWVAEHGTPDPARATH